MKITKIPAVLDRFTAQPIEMPKKRRVAGYARVSTDHEDQNTSYAAQVDYYTNYIQNKEEWEFAGIYTDEGISGTSTKRREGFNRMIADALDGKIDLIITKSVSRFARNTVDSLSTIRKLKEHNVECYFEKENIWTFDAKGELLITIMSSLAQEESRSISENVTWGQRKRFADGKVSFPYKVFLGYTKVNDQIVVVPEEAEVVKLIYKLYLEGYSQGYIAKTLTDMHIKTPFGKDKWGQGSIRSILTNEKYKGDALLQKTFTVDFLTKKMKKNEGEVTQYYVHNSQPAIIEPRIFDLVQVEMQRRRQSTTCYNAYSVYSKKIKCGECGGWFGPKIWHSTDQYRRKVYQCDDKYKKHTYCKTPVLTEEQINKAFIKMVNKLIKKKDSIIGNLELLKRLAQNPSSLYNKQDKLQEDINAVVETAQSLTLRNSTQAADQKKYMEIYNEQVSKYDSLKAEFDSVTGEITKQQNTALQIDNMIHVLMEQNGPITEFSNNLWSSLLDHMVVYTDKHVEFVLRDGSVHKEKI